VINNKNIYRIYFTWYTRKLIPEDISCNLKSIFENLHLKERHTRRFVENIYLFV